MFLIRYDGHADSDDEVIWADLVNSVPSETTASKNLVSIGVGLEPERMRTIVHMLCCKKPDLLKKLNSLRTRHWGQVKDDSDQLACEVSERLNKDFGKMYSLSFGKLPFSIDYEHVAKVLFCSVIETHDQHGHYFTFAAVQLKKGDRRESDFLHARVSLDGKPKNGLMIELALFRHTLSLLAPHVKKLIFYDKEQIHFIHGKVLPATPECKAIGFHLLAAISGKPLNETQPLPDIQQLVIQAASAISGRLSHVTSQYERLNQRDEQPERNDQRHAITNAKSLYSLYDSHRDIVSIN